jgi:hypothetical protein
MATIIAEVGCLMPCRFLCWQFQALKGLTYIYSMNISCQHLEMANFRLSVNGTIKLSQLSFIITVINKLIVCWRVGSRKRGTPWGRKSNVCTSPARITCSWGNNWSYDYFSLSHISRSGMLKRGSQFFILVKIRFSTESTWCK